MMTKLSELLARFAGGPLSDLARLLRFYSRLPVPRLPGEGDPHLLPDFTRAPRMLPLAGAIIGSIGAIVLWSAAQLGLGPAASAILCIASLVVVTGAFHEDGLADSADGLWGGATVERRLEIMKDSRIGTYGGAALVLSLLLRVAVLAELTGRMGPATTALIVIAAAALSRCCGLVPLTLLPPARADGASAQVGRPTSFTLCATLAGAVVLATLLAVPSGLYVGTLGGCVAAMIAAAGVTAISERKIDGQTGDVAGAAQQLAEIAFLLWMLGSL